MLVRTLAYDPSSGRLVSGSYDRSIKLWDVQTGRVLREFRGLHYSHIFDVKFNCCRIVRYVRSLYCLQHRTHFFHQRFS